MGSASTRLYDSILHLTRPLRSSALSLAAGSGTRAGGAAAPALVLRGCATLLYSSYKVLESIDVELWSERSSHPEPDPNW